MDHFISLSSLAFYRFSNAHLIARKSVLSSGKAALADKAKKRPDEAPALLVMERRQSCGK